MSLEESFDFERLASFVTGYFGDLFSGKSTSSGVPGRVTITLSIRFGVLRTSSLKSKSVSIFKEFFFCFFDFLFSALALRNTLSMILDSVLFIISSSSDNFRLMLSDIFDRLFFFFV
eukprot:NODE_204_length_12954_cov_1.347880.p10 type:complete len:117 gc:universal NODE_204_length_12954_cov_1.347880:10401-10051(-)